MFKQKVILNLGLCSLKFQQLLSPYCQFVQFSSKIKSFPAVILRGLDALTSEENIVAAVQKISAVVMKNIRIMRDPLTQVSKGHAFIEMGSIGDSCKLIDAISKLHGPFEVDGKAIIVNYAKNTFSTVWVEWIFFVFIL